MIYDNKGYDTRYNVEFRHLFKSCQFKLSIAITMLSNGFLVTIVLVFTMCLSVVWCQQQFQQPYPYKPLYTYQRPYPNLQYPMGQYPQIPTEIIDLPPNAEFPSLGGSISPPIISEPKRRMTTKTLQNNGKGKGIPPPHTAWYPYQNYPHLQQPQDNVYPQYLFNRFNDEYPLGYFVVPAESKPTSNNRPQYVIRENKSHFESSSSPQTKKTFSTITEVKPIHTTIHRYFKSENGKPLVEVTVDGKRQGVGNDTNVVVKKFVTNVENGEIRTSEVPSGTEERDENEVTQDVEENNVGNNGEDENNYETTTVDTEPEDVLSWL